MPRPVKVEQVQEYGREEERFFNGTARAEVETKLSFKVAGTIEKLPVQSGMYVKAGDLIAQLDPLDYQLQEQEAQASLLDAEAKMRNALSDYARIRELYETKSVSRQELDAARTAADSSKANVKAATKRLEQAKAQLDYTTLRAPSDGALFSVPVEERENVTVGQTIAVIHLGNLINVEVPMPENYIAEIKKGEDVRVTFDSQPGKSFTASVFKIGVASGASTTFPVTVKLKEAAAGIKPGMTAEVLFHFKAKEGGGVIVPASAVIGENGARFVFVVHRGADNVATVERRSVEIGRITNQGMQILKGLQAGDWIVTAGGTFLQDGEKVRVME
jgi:membrane fusion protein, multidrug efflux system